MDSGWFGEPSPVLQLYDGLYSSRREVDSNMVRNLLQRISMVLALITLLCGCSQIATDAEITTEPNVTTMPVETTTPTQPAKTVAEHPIPVIPDEYWTDLWVLNKRTFMVMFGEECIRETPKYAYAIVQQESGRKCIICFDNNDKFVGGWLWDEGIFHSNEDFLDFVVGTNPTMAEMDAYDSPRTYIYDVEAHYTQEGVFIISFVYKTIYIDGVAQGTNRYLKIVDYFDYEDLLTAQDPDAAYALYLFPEDRGTENGLREP